MESVQKSIVIHKSKRKTSAVTFHAFGENLENSFGQHFPENQINFKLINELNTSRLFNAKVLEIIEDLLVQSTIELFNYMNGTAEVKLSEGKGFTKVTFSVVMYKSFVEHLMDPFSGDGENILIDQFIHLNNIFKDNRLGRIYFKRDERKVKGRVQSVIFYLNT